MANFTDNVNFSNNPKFKLGQLVTTPGAEDVFKLRVEALEILRRHQSGDWGDMPADDKKLNDEAIANEGNTDKMGRVMSEYTVHGTRLWVITEWDRSVTTILLPSEY